MLDTLPDKPGGAALALDLGIKTGFSAYFEKRKTRGRVAYAVRAGVRMDKWKAKAAEGRIEAVFKW